MSSILTGRDTFRAASAIVEHRAVKLATTTSSGQRNVTAITATSDVFIGFSENDATAAGQSVNVKSIGYAFAQASAAIAIGARVGLTANGRIVTVTSGNYIGTAIDVASAAEDVILVKIDQGQV